MSLTIANHIFVQKGHAYRCFCDRRQLGNIKEALRKKGSNATYDKRCLHLSEEEVHRRIKAGEKYVVRLDVRLQFCCMLILR